MKKIFILFILMCLTISCEDNVLTENIPDPDPLKLAKTDEEFALYNFGNSIEANFFGQVFDKKNRGLKNVKISIGGKSTMTDHNGVFIIKNVSAYENFAYIKASKDGYIDGGKTIIPTTNGFNNVKINLLDKNFVGSVNSGSTSSLSLLNGTKIEFKGDFINSSGDLYSGKVDVFMHYLEPNEQITFQEMPGMLFGMREDGSASGMETYGMVAVDLFSPTGEELNISEDSPATLVFPISATTPVVDKEIPLWYFDETTGYWKEQGFATKTGNEFRAKVTHFSWWNCDIPFDGVNICFELKNDNPLTNLSFKISRILNGQTIFIGETNNIGQECGLFPKDEELKMYVYSDCNGEVIFEKNLGPYSKDAMINLEMPNFDSQIGTTTLQGSVSNCNNEIVENGYALIYMSGESDSSKHSIVPISEGFLNYQMTYCISDDYNIVVYDLDKNEVSEVVNLNLTQGTTSLENVSTCGGNIGGKFDGFVTLLTQEEVDQFALFGFTEVLGLTLGEKSVLIDTNNISSIENLSSITTVGGYLNVYNTSLKDLSGLENLKSVGGINLKHNYSLESLTALEKIASVRLGISIINNDSLAGLDGLDNISSPVRGLDIEQNDDLVSIYGIRNIPSIDDGGLAIKENASLINLEGLENITYVHGSIEIEKNPSLTSLKGLENVEYLSDVSGGVFNHGYSGRDTSLWGCLTISENNSLTDLSGINSLKRIAGYLKIGGNDSLVSLNGLDNLSNVSFDIPDNSVYDLDIVIGTGRGYLGSLPNKNLSDFCALTNLMTNGTIGRSSGNVRIVNNLYNPSVQDLEDGQCKL